MHTPSHPNDEKQQPKSKSIEINNHSSKQHSNINRNLHLATANKLIEGRVVGQSHKTALRIVNEHSTINNQPFATVNRICPKSTLNNRGKKKK